MHIFKFSDKEKQGLRPLVVLLTILTQLILTLHCYFAMICS